MISYKDLNGLDVDLSFEENKFNIEARHVLVVLKHEGKWLLTEHRERGVEFPGGKVEEWETLEEAAIRETVEETGVTISKLEKFAEYVVHDADPFCKAVFTGSVVQINKSFTRRETAGVVWMTDTELNSFGNLSFHMKDAGMSAIRKWVDAYDYGWVD